VPFAALGGLVAIRGRRRWFVVSATILVVSGLGIWILARSGNHIGASAIVFGYFGHLVASAVYEKRAGAVAAAAVAIVLYGGLLLGLLPTSTVSWEGHLFGLLAGWASVALVRRRE
jgi:membrane associated rhomboid family serine protease